MRILFAGTPQTAIPSLTALAEHHDVVGVLTRAPAPVGRKRILTPSPVQLAAENLGIPVYTPQSLHDTGIEQTIRELAPEAVAVVAYGLLVPQKLLDIPTHGWLNLHYSLLPRWRGASPVQCAIAAGDTTIGTSVFQLEKGLDTGPVADMEEHEVSGRTAGEMLTYLSDTGVRQLVRVFAELENGTATFTAQTGEPTHAPLLRARDVKIDWTASAPAVDAWIRGFTPEPGPWTMLDGQRVKVGPVRVRPEITHLAPGEIAPGKQVLVGTGEAAVELGQVAPAGKTWMNAADWARGIKTDNPRFEVVDK